MTQPLKPEMRSPGFKVTVSLLSNASTCAAATSRLEKRAKGDAFKIRSYISAAAAIRDLEYEVGLYSCCVQSTHMLKARMVSNLEPIK